MDSHSSTLSPYTAIHDFNLYLHYGKSSFRPDLQSIISHVNNAQHKCYLAAKGFCNTCNSYLAKRSGQYLIIDNNAPSAHFDRHAELLYSRRIADLKFASELAFQFNELDTDSEAITLTIPEPPAPTQCDRPHLDDHSCDLPNAPEPCELPHLASHTCPAPPPCDQLHLLNHTCPTVPVHPPLPSDAYVLTHSNIPTIVQDIMSHLPTTFFIPLDTPPTPTVIKDRYASLLTRIEREIHHQLSLTIPVDFIDSIPDEHSPATPSPVLQPPVEETDATPAPGIPGPEYTLPSLPLTSIEPLSFEAPTPPPPSRTIYTYNDTPHPSREPTPINSNNIELATTLAATLIPLRTQRSITSTPPPQLYLQPPVLLAPTPTPIPSTLPSFPEPTLAEQEAEEAAIADAQAAQAEEDYQNSLLAPPPAITLPTPQRPRGLFDF